jgi:hypothetical protein
MHFLHTAAIMVALLLCTNEISMQVLEHVVFCVRFTGSDKVEQITNSRVKSNQAIV